MMDNNCRHLHGFKALETVKNPSTYFYSTLIINFSTIPEGISSHTQWCEGSRSKLKAQTSECSEILILRGCVMRVRKQKLENSHHHRLFIMILMPSALSPPPCSKNHPSNVISSNYYFLTPLTCTSLCVFQHFLTLKDSWWLTRNANFSIKREWPTKVF